MDVPLVGTPKPASGPSHALLPILWGGCFIPRETQRGRALCPRSHSGYWNLGLLTTQL